MNKMFVTKFPWEKSQKDFKGKKRRELGLEQNHSKPDGQQGTKLEGIPSLKNYVQKGRQKHKTAKSAWKQAAVCVSEHKGGNIGQARCLPPPTAELEQCALSRHNRFSHLSGAVVALQYVHKLFLPSKAGT